MKIIVVYKSKYGTAEQYAKWIAEELNCDIKEMGEIRARDLDAYDGIIFEGKAEEPVYLHIDDELVRNIEADCAARLERKRNGKPMRFLLTIGGAGAQKEIFAAILEHLLPAIREKRAAVYVNIGDYRKVWKYLLRAVPGLKELSTTHFDQWDETCAFASDALTGPVEGVHAFCHKDIFEAVYCTNLLMRSADVLATKPSELAFYPVPKLFIKRIGGHERWGAIHSAEVGDGTLECEDIPHTIQMLDLFLNEDTLLRNMCENICKNKAVGLYDGAYQAVRLAMEGK